MRNRLICLIGPTAVGKTEVALALAKKIGAEIISCDSMQVYKGVDVATSKPTKRQRRLIPHHLIDIVEPSGEYNAARFRKACLKTIEAIHKRKKLPLIVAGCGLYLKALLDGLFRGPGQNVSLRKELLHKATRYGSDYLYKRLKKLDPDTARCVHPHDLRRIIRALEIYELTGLPISKLKRDRSGLRDKYEVHIFGLMRRRGQLYSRIEERVDRMFRRGLVAEIRRLTSCKISKTARSLLGYKEVLGFLNGKYSRDEAKGLLKRNTRRYAKRQLCWFKKEKQVKWIEIGSEDSPEIVAERICSFLDYDVGDRKR